MAYNPEINRGEIFQYYTNKTFLTTKLDHDDGELRVAADLRWVQLVLLADDTTQKLVFQTDFAQQRRKIHFFYYAWYFFIMLAMLTAYLSFNIYSIGVLLFWLYFLSIYSGNVIKHPKGWGVILLFASAVAMICYLVWGQWAYVGFSVLTGLCFLWPHFTVWYIERATLSLLLNNYEFFRVMTGRAKDSNERPPIVLSVPTALGFKGVAWDENPEPALRDFQVHSGHPIIAGRDYDYYLSIPDCRLICVFVGCYLSYVTKLQGHYCEVIATFAVILSIINSFICPSQHFCEFRRFVNSKKMDGDSLVVAIIWSLYNIIWTMACLYAVGLAFQFVWPYCGELVEYVSKWRTRH